ncbi:MAG: phosphoribosylaminoimidazolesuccinocarboxamide synthase [Deltaproteobacteria bacterium]|nr:phosphoribosylaminoimidazolesuccinocarboxamide synthase [Deltaproteobacteria bacterium]
MATDLDAALHAALRHPLERTDLFALGDKYEGKVRDNYSRDGVRTIIVSDRVSAFDRVLGTLPLKGQLLNHVAAYWFEKTRHVVPNHMVRIPDPNVLVAEECTPLPVEMIVRAYLTGTTSTSIWVHYEKGARTFCGHRLPDGMVKHQKLPQPILTPSTKAAHGDHDVSASREEILARTGMAAEDFDTAADMAMRLFAFGQEHCAARGLILVDTKYEFGRTRDGRIVVIDEIHTPDSSRFWFTATYAERLAAQQDPESFDKEYLRRFLAERGFRGDGPIPEIPDEVRVEASRRYVRAVETVTGEPFRPDLEDPLPRIRRNLGLP